MGHNFWNGCCQGGFWGMPWMGSWSAVLGLIFSVILIVGAAWLLIWLIRRTAETSSQGRADSGRHSDQQTVLEILKVRYARGEISREEYRDMKQDLED